MQKPSVGLILGYKHFFNDPIPNDRMELIKSISKVDLITELAGCNYRIKPPAKIFFDFKVEIDISELQYHLRTNPEIRDKAISIFLNHLKTTSSNSIIFSRAAMLFSINEVMKCKDMKNKENFIFSQVDQLNIFKYILLVNDEITKYHKEIFQVDEFSGLEKVNLATLSLNEYLIPIEPLLTLFRAGSLYKYLEQTKYKDSLVEFFETNTDLSAQKYIYEIARMLMTKVKSKKMTDFLYELDKDSYVLQLFKYLSMRRDNPDKELEFLNIKKSPFYDGGRNRFIMLDNMFLLSLTYDLFVWSFLFDHLLKGDETAKERERIIKEFKGTIGLFFEKHLSEILESIANTKNYFLRTFNDLVFRISKKEIEFSDVYLRKENNVIIGEAKTTPIISKEKYASSISEFYDRDPDKFFKKHGLNQLVNGIKHFIQYNRLIDNGLKRRGIKIYPILFINDPLLLNPFFPKIFDNQFKKMIYDLEIPPCMKVLPLTMIHTSDLEMIEGILTTTKQDIFELIKIHIAKYDNHLPFYYTSNEVSNRIYSQRVIDYHRSLIIEESGSK